LTQKKKNLSRRLPENQPVLERIDQRKSWLLGRFLAHLMRNHRTKFPNFNFWPITVDSRDCTNTAILKLLCHVNSLWCFDHRIWIMGRGMYKPVVSN